MDVSENAASVAQGGSAAGVSEPRPRSESVVPRRPAVHFGAVLLSLVLIIAAQEGPVDPAVDAPAPAPVQAAPVAMGTHFRGAVEGLFSSFPSGTPGGQQDFFANVTPLIGFDGGDDFGFELGADLRLRVFDDPPEQRERDYGRMIRRADWDETSDYGQILRELRIGRDGGPFVLRAGPIRNFTLGNGHLVNRYWNRGNADYHPAGATAELAIGATRTVLFASDVLGARLFAAEVAADLGRMMDGEPDRYRLALSAAHDAGLAGHFAPPSSALHVDFDLVLRRTEAARVLALFGVGSRMAAPGVDVGGVVGIAAEGEPGGIQLGGKLELRKQAGAFRHGYFGPTYELSRFAGLGLTGEPLAYERLPDAWSGYLEVQLSSGPPTMGPDEESRLSLSLAAEHFAFGRTDADVALALRTLGGHGTALMRAAVVGHGVMPRYQLEGQARYRFAPAFYALAATGTAFFPQPDQTLWRGAFVGVGVGADFER